MISLKSDGTVWTWGNNQYGQLGNGDIENYNTGTPQQVIAPEYDENNQVYLENIQQIAAGTYSAVALMQDGRVVTWGQNNVGQLGQNFTANGSLPGYVVDENGRYIENIKQIVAGDHHMLALTNNGEVYAWGQNRYGALGQGVAHTTTSNVNYKRIYAVKVTAKIDTGETDEAGNIIYDYPVLSGIKQVSAGNEFSVALKESGEVWAWGLGTTGQLGQGVKANSYYAIKSNMSDIKKVSAGGVYVLALKNDGTVWGWGQNNYGQLGNNATIAAQLGEVQAKWNALTPITNVVDISTIYQTSYVIYEEDEELEDGTIIKHKYAGAFGYGGYGQLGNGVLPATTSHYVKIGNTIVKNSTEYLDNVELIGSGPNTHAAMVMDEDGKLYGLGQSNYGRMMGERNSNSFIAWPLDSDYVNLSNNQEYIEVGNTIKLSADYYNGFNLKLNEKNITNLTYESSDTNILTVDQSGNITAVSRGIANIIVTDQNTGNKAQSIINVVNKGAKAIPMVQTGNLFTVMLKEDGTVWTAGNSTNGSLGTNYNKQQLEPVQVLKEDETPLTGIRKISVRTKPCIST